MVYDICKNHIPLLKKAIEQIIKDHPSWLWGYISWGDLYSLSDEKDAEDLAKAEKIYRMALERGAEDEDSALAERLEDLEEMKKPIKN